MPVQTIALVPVPLTADRMKNALLGIAEAAIVLAFVLRRKAIEAFSCSGKRKSTTVYSTQPSGFFSVFFEKQNPSIEYSAGCLEP
jgi:hypothetical protein